MGNNEPLDGQMGKEKDKHFLFSDNDRVRNILAVGTVFGFFGLVAIIVVVFPLFGIAPTDDIIPYLKYLSSIFSGIIGLIIGYYFGKH